MDLWGECHEKKQVPKFYGNSSGKGVNIRHFCDKIEIWKRKTNSNNSQTAKYAKHFLYGDAFMWLETHPQADIIASSWQSLKEHLLKRFGGLLNAKRLIEDSMQQKDFETLQEYMYRVKVNVQEMTVDDCKSTQTLQVQDTWVQRFFVAGLKSNLIRSYISTRVYSSSADLLDRAVWAQENIHEIRLHATFASSRRLQENDSSLMSPISEDQLDTEETIRALAAPIDLMTKKNL